MANSPWGQIQYSTVFGRGFKSVGTSGHGGYMLTEQFAIKNLSPEAIALGDKYQEGRYVRTQRTYYCYEEDCLWAIPALELLDKFGDKMFATAGEKYATYEQRRAAIIRSLSGYNADFLIVKGIEPEAERYADYLRWQERDRLEASKSSDLIISASGDWHEACRAGECLVVTADGRTHFVTAASYAACMKNGIAVNLLSNCVLSRGAGRQEGEVAELWA